MEAGVRTAAGRGLMLRFCRRAKRSTKTTGYLVVITWLRGGEDLGRVIKTGL